MPGAVPPICSHPFRPRFGEGLSDEFHRVGDLALVIELHLYIAVVPKPEIGDAGGQLARVAAIVEPHVGGERKASSEGKACPSGRSRKQAQTLSTWRSPSIAASALAKSGDRVTPIASARFRIALCCMVMRCAERALRILPVSLRGEGR